MTFGEDFVLPQEYIERKEAQDTMMYEKIILDIGAYNRVAKGLETLLIEIGKNEYRKKIQRAQLERKEFFKFPSEAVKKEMLWRSVNDANAVSNAMYLQEGIFRINKMAKMGRNNKRAIRRLIYANMKTIPDRGSHYVFYLHRYKTWRIYDAIYTYIHNEMIDDTQNQKQAIDTLRDIRKMCYPSQATGSEIIANPYRSEVVRAQEFPGQERIKREYKRFDEITGLGGV